MAVALNNTGTVSRVISATSLSYTGLTVGSGSNRALIGNLNADAAITSVTMTWDSGGTNQSMASIGSNKENTWNRWSFANGLVAPTSGNKTCSVSWTTSSTVRFAMSDYTGVDQTGGTTSFAGVTGNNGSSNTASVNVTSTSSDLALAMAINSSGSAATESHTQLQEATSGDPPIYTQYTTAGGSPVAFTWTFSGSTTWGALGFNIVASGGAAAASGYGMLRASYRNRSIVE